MNKLSLVLLLGLAMSVYSSGNYTCPTTEDKWECVKEHKGCCFIDFTNNGQTKKPCGSVLSTEDNPNIDSSKTTKGYCD